MIITEEKLNEIENNIKAYLKNDVTGIWIAPVGSDTVLAMIAEIRSCWSQLDDYHYWGPDDP